MNERLTQRKDVTHTVSTRLLFEIRDLLEGVLAATKRRPAAKVTVTVQASGVTAAREALEAIMEYRGEPSGSHAWDFAMRDIAREGIAALDREHGAVSAERHQGSQQTSESAVGLLGREEPG